MANLFAALKLFHLYPPSEPRYLPFGTQFDWISITHKFFRRDIYPSSLWCKIFECKQLESQLLVKQAPLSVKWTPPPPFTTQSVSPPPHSRCHPHLLLSPSIQLSLSLSAALAPLSFLPPSTPGGARYYLFTPRPCIPLLLTWLKDKAAKKGRKLSQGAIT